MRKDDEAGYRVEARPGINSEVPVPSASGPVRCRRPSDTCKLATSLHASAHPHISSVFAVREVEALVIATHDVIRQSHSGIRLPGLGQQP